MVNRFVFFLLIPIFLFGRGKAVWQEIDPNLEPPWLTGPLVAPSPYIVPLGHINIEPYLSSFAYTGIYSSDWDAMSTPTLSNNVLTVFVQVGLSSWMNITLTPNAFWNYSEHEASWQFGDMNVGLDMQLYYSRPTSPIPYIKLFLRETIPFGKYRNLDPKKNQTDVGGDGSWITNFGLVFGNLYHFYSVYYLSYRLAFIYALPAPTRLKGFNCYGGGYGTNARFFPSENFQIDFSFELTLSQNWAFAMDLIGYWAGKSHFSGVRGTLADGALAPLGRGSQAQFSLAPAIEYNWNENLGLIAGSWFTVAGRKAPVFSSVVIALNYYK